MDLDFNLYQLSGKRLTADDNDDEGRSLSKRIEVSKKKVNSIAEIAQRMRDEGLEEPGQLTPFTQRFIR